MPFLAIIPLFQTALSTIAAFKGSAASAKVTGYFQDAVGVVTALTPLVQQFASGEEVTLEQARESLVGQDAAIKTFDELIAQKSQP